MAAAGLHVAVKTEKKKVAERRTRRWPTALHAGHSAAVRGPLGPVRGSAALVHATRTAPASPRSPKVRGGSLERHLRDFPLGSNFGGFLSRVTTEATESFSSDHQQKQHAGTHAAGRAGRAPCACTCVPQVRLGGARGTRRPAASATILFRTMPRGQRPVRLRAALAPGGTWRWGNVHPTRVHKMARLACSRCPGRAPRGAARRDVTHVLFGAIFC